MFLRNRLEHLRELVQLDKSGDSPEKLLAQLPYAPAERYMNGRAQNWQRWAKKFLELYGNSPEEARIGITQQLITQTDSAGYITKDLFIVEALWDFGASSPFYENVPEIFHAVMRHYQEKMSPKEFEALVKRLRNVSSFPVEHRDRYDQYDSVPSKELQARTQRVIADKDLERKILQLGELPDDPNIMESVLKKMSKKDKSGLYKFGLPRRTSFLLEVRRKYSQVEEWEEIEEAIQRLNVKHPEWFATQLTEPLR